MPIPKALRVLSPITNLFAGDGGGKGGRKGSTPSFKRGGTMKKGGVAKLHKDEMIRGKKRGRKGRGRGRE